MRRLRLEQAILQDKTGVALAGAKAMYANDPVMFIHDCVWMYEPRNANKREPTLIPAVPFPRQREFIEWLHERFSTGQAGPVEKSRDSGATWIAASFAVWIWLFHPGASVGFGSRKEILVDRKGDMNSIFEKVRMIIRKLPSYLRPAGFAESEHMNFMRILNPENECSIIGEAGDNIGRGGRTAIYFIDEAQPLDAKVLTPEGWHLIGEIAVGDTVCGPDGTDRMVVGINDCGDHAIYRIGFSDGTFVECTENHIWAVDAVIGTRHRKLLRTREMLSDFKYESPGGQIQYRYRVPLCEPVEFCAAGPLPLDPYLCGALIGDGSYANGTVRITTADLEIIESFHRLLPLTVRVGKHDGRYAYNLVSAGEGRGRAKGGGYKQNQMRLLLDESGLEPTTGPHKKIPELYKKASRGDRLALLQGLMDTDGYCSGFGGASFHTSSSALADDVQFVVRSLGGMCWHTVKSDARGHLDQHCIQVSMPDGVNPFRLKRKAEAYNKRRGRPLSRAIVSITKTEPRTARCISVDAEDGLYITDNFTVTHNSAFLEHPELVDAGLTATTDCRVDISTPNVGSVFDAWCAATTPPDKFIFDLSDAPWHTPEWCKKKKNELEIKGLGHLYRREYLRDAAAGLAGQLISSEWVESAIGAADKLKIKISGKKVGSLDVADGGSDASAFTGRHGISLEFLQSRPEILADESGAWAYREAMMRGLAELRYDSIGVGSGAAAALRDKKGIKIVGWAGSDAVINPDTIYEGNRTHGDMFLNRKAQAWWMLRDRFILTHRCVTLGHIPDDVSADDLISISPDLPEIRELKTELTQVTYKDTQAGKVQINKAPDGQKSPNRADSVVINFSLPAPEIQFGLIG